MVEDDIDFDRVITDPKYRREVIDFLNAKSDGRGADNVIELRPESSARDVDRATRSSKSVGADAPQG